LRIEGVRLPHFQFIDGRSGDVVAADEPRLLGVPVVGALFGPAGCFSGGNCGEQKKKACNKYCAEVGHLVGHLYDSAYNRLGAVDMVQTGGMVGGLSDEATNLSSAEKPRTREILRLADSAQNDAIDVLQQVDGIGISVGFGDSATGYAGGRGSATSHGVNDDGSATVTKHGVIVGAQGDVGRDSVDVSSAIG